MLLLATVFAGYAVAGALQPQLRLPDNAAAKPLQEAGYAPADAQAKAPALAPANDEGLVFYGLLRQSNAYPMPKPGVYSFKPFASDWEITPLKTGETDYDFTYCGTRGGVYANGKLYVINNNTSKLTCFDTETWEMTEIAPVGASFSGQWATDLAWDPVADKVYGCFITGWDQYAFGTIDLTDATVTNIKDLGAAYYHVLVTTLSGDLYGIANDGVFYSINKADGTATAVGSTGVNLNQYFSTSTVQDAVVDPVSGRLYWFNNAPSFPVMYEVDMTTGKASSLGYTPKAARFGTIFIPYELESPESPVLIADLSVVFADIEGNGTATFTLPATKMSGDAITGTLTYEVKAAGQPVASGQGSAGEAVSVPIATAAKGEISVDVLVTTSEGKKSTTGVKVWAGADTPGAVEGISFAKSVTHRSVSLSWKAPERGIHGGVVDASALRYRIVRQPDNLVIAQNLAATTYDDTPVNNKYTSYTYEISAEAGGLEGTVAVTPVINLGPPMTVPFRENFSDGATFSLLDIVDFNNDGVSWSRYASNDADGDAYAQCDASDDVAKDDWLMLPPLALKRGTQYVLTFKASALMISYPEVLEVMAGLAATPDNMTIEIISQREVENEMSWSWHTYTASFEVPDDGDYTIGFHALSPAARYRLAIDDIAIDGATKDSPASVADLKATPATDGSFAATVSFTVPSRTQGGAPLADGIGADIIVNNNTVRTLTGLKPGQKVAETVETAEGSNDVTVICRNDAGMSMAANTTVFTGHDSPGKVRNLTAHVSGGNVVLTWDAPLGEHGGYVDPANLTYTVIRYFSSDNYEAFGPVYETTYTDVYESDQQTMLTYLVYAHEVGSSAFGPSEITNTVVAGGSYYTLPYEETFLSGFPSKICGVVSIDASRGAWSLWNELAENETANPQDNDYGCIYFAPYKAGDRVRFFSGNIALGNVANPELSFWVNPTQSRGTLDIEISVEGGQWSNVGKIDFSKERITGWCKISVPLKEFLGSEFIQFSFVATAADDISRIYVDNIAIANVFNQDLALDIKTRKNFYLDRDNEITLFVTNKGKYAASGYDIVLYRDGTPVKTFTGPKLDADGALEYTYVENISVESPLTATYHAELTYYADENSANNRTPDMPVRNRIEPFPAPGQIEASADNAGNVKLAWAAPEKAECKSLGRVTETFEDYESFIIEDMGDWEMVDVDGQDGTFPIIQAFYPHMREPKAWMVWNLWDLSASADETTTWNPVSGHQLLVSFCDLDNENDDWLISPELDGSAHTVTFFAKSITILYGDEPFEMYYSTTSRDLSSFVKAGEGAVSVDWTEFSFDVPENARFFAIRRVGSGVVLCLDDISYSAGNGIPADLELVGYNVYRDGSKVNDNTVARPAFDDVLPDGFTHTYSVSAVYNHGESKATPLVDVYPGLNGIIYAEAAQPVVKAVEGAILVEGADGMPLRLYRADGVMCHSAVAGSHDRIDAATGIYVLTVGPKAYKIRVK